MAESDTKKTRSWFNLLGLSILAFSYAMAVYHMYQVRVEEFSDEVATIRIVHWQLESGVRDAVDAMARKFEKDYFKETGKRVKIIQIPIGERAYRQYVTTQCVGGTAPDLIEMGMGMNSSQVAKFFIPLTNILFKPNPYNKGTDLEKIAWKNTFFDGLSGSFDRLALEYYGVGLSCFTVRLFYNKRIVKEAVGSDAPPKDFREFIRICKKLNEWAREHDHKSFVPIAAAFYQANLFRWRFENTVLLDFCLQHDRDFDGVMFGLEPLLGYAGGDYDYSDPAIKAGQGIIYEMTNYFPPGFMQVDRMEAGFRFSQQNAAFITSGSWDAYSYIQQADFPIGICDFPLPTRSDPEVGHLVKGKITESGIKTGFRFGLTRFSKHPEVAIRFLQYLTTRKRNEEFNRIIKWLPVINGAKPHPVIKAFSPIKDGFWTCSPVGRPVGNASRGKMIYEQYLREYMEHRCTFEKYVENVDKNIPDGLASDYERTMQFLHEDINSLGTKGSGFMAQYVFNPDPAARKVAADKLAYVWEARVQRYADETRWPLRWKKLLTEKKPRALKIDEKILNK